LLAFELIFTAPAIASHPRRRLAVDGPQVLAGFASKTIHLILLHDTRVKGIAMPMNKLASREIFEPERWLAATSTARAHPSTRPRV
jgi:hypothetical protein